MVLRKRENVDKLCFLKVHCEYKKQVGTFVIHFPQTQAQKMSLLSLTVIQPLRPEHLTTFKIFHNITTEIPFYMVLFNNTDDTVH